MSKKNDRGLIINQSNEQATATEPTTDKGKPRPNKLKDKRKAPEPEKPVLHPEIRYVKFIGDKGFTAKHSAELLGLVPVENYDDTCCEEIKQLTGLNVRLTKNQRNRPFRMDQILGLTQAVLSFNTRGKRVWRFNGVNMIVDKCGDVVNAQHRGAAVWYSQWLIDNGPEHIKAHWQDLWRQHYGADWDGIIRVDTGVLYGVDNDDDTFCTYNLDAPASDADAVFRSPWFASYPAEKRKRLSKLCANAVKFMLERTGHKFDAYTPRRSPAETTDFLSRHPKLVDCVVFVDKEGDQHKKDAQVINPLGELAGVLYLTGCSSTGGSTGERDEMGQLIDYAQAQPKPNENVLKWKDWKLACEFMKEYLQVNPKFRDLEIALREITGDLTVPPTRQERIGVLCLAWHRYKDGEGMTQKRLALTRDDHGKLVPAPTFGGIDMGGVKPREVEEEEEDHTGEYEGEVVEEGSGPGLYDPDAKEIEDRAKKVKEKAKPATNGIASIVKQLQNLEKLHVGKTLFFYNSKDQKYQAWGTHASTVAGICTNLRLKKEADYDGLGKVAIPIVDWNKYLKELQGAGVEVAIVSTNHAGQVSVNDAGKAL